MRGGVNRQVVVPVLLPVVNGVTAFIYKKRSYDARRYMLERAGYYIILDEG